jgi:hypothetical protein
MSQYIGPCDRIRRTSSGDLWWHSVMRGKRRITEEEFLAVIDPSDILDEDETFDEFLKIHGYTSFYQYKNTYLIADDDPNGFELFWTTREKESKS